MDGTGGTDERGEGIAAPVEPALRSLLRLAVVDHARSEPRRVHPALLHVGQPGGAQAVFAFGPDEPQDHTLRTDVVAAMLRRCARTGDDSPVVWLTRTGGLELQDADAAWLAAARAATAEAKRPLTMVVVTRRGWRDPRSGVGRVWKRVRPADR
ncbi:hypothetical protein FB382_002111 [Nocardioides ginsengisegetis]|uniref:Uncharacterized protein n=1 Tax=Nocardioides ginsengisegetis TaxID=661491 RepID=A0A7W3P9M1_9ACTN|nr:hypothetical protein [Nocardioides ginsengisegetis]MBA8803820.1 hypothetical protein [Nocardioides ginsengisegetis]